MAGDVEVSFREDQFREVRRLLRSVPKAWPKVASRGINKTLSTLRSRFVKRTSAQAGIKQKVIREHVRIKKATRSVLSGLLRLLGGRIPLIDLKARQDKKGVSYTGRDGKRSSVPSAFIATMPSGHTGVFKRTTGSRLPIQELFGPSLTGVFEKTGDIQRETMDETEDLLEHYTAQEADRELERRKG